MGATRKVSVQAYREGENVSASVVDSTSGYKVAGTTVVGAQGASLADVNVGALTLLTEAITAIGTLQTALNTALARLRAHGLIAP